MSKAREFTELVGTEVQPWMEWEGWTGWVGCGACTSDGPEAPCWGRADCHGYFQGVGAASVLTGSEKKPDRPGRPRPFPFSLRIKKGVRLMVNMVNWDDLPLLLKVQDVARIMQMGARIRPTTFAIARGFLSCA